MTVGKQGGYFFFGSEFSFGTYLLSLIITDGNVKGVNNADGGTKQIMC